ncbi:hypothetical protein BDW69DRAFT_175735 [Aspergillus filifer]
MGPIGRNGTRSLVRWLWFFPSVVALSPVHQHLLHRKPGTLSARPDARPSLKSQHSGLGSSPQRLLPRARRRLRHHSQSVPSVLP